MKNHQAVVEALNAGESQKTLDNLCLFAEPVDPPDRSTRIWNFKKKAWIKWEPKEDKAAAGEMLFRCAQKILKVMYFCSHRCETEPLKDYIPDEFILQVFTADEWSKMVKAEEAKI